MNKTVFLTGATGVIGSRLMPELLKDPEVSLKLLIRAKSDKELEERMLGILRFWDVDTNDRSVMSRVEGLRGDVTSESLGLSESSYEALAGGVTHIIHCAANIKLMLSIEEARRFTLQGTKNVVALAQKCVQNGQFKRFNHLSTGEVAGNMTGKVPEDFITTKRGFLNTYEAAKAEAEDIFKGLSQKGFPVTIYRPTMVVGDSVTGKTIKFQSFYTTLLKEALLSPAGPVIPGKADWMLDTIPVDFVAKVIAHLYDKQEPTAKVYNVAAGSEAVSLETFLKEASDILTSITGKKLKIPGLINPAIVLAILTLSKFLTFGPARKKIKFQLMLCRFSLLEYVFDNSGMKKAMSENGVKLPVLKEYIRPILEYYLKNAKGLNLEGGV